MPTPPKPPVNMTINGRDLDGVIGAAVLGIQDRPYVITDARIKDDYCHYAFLVTQGQERGAEHNVKIDNEITEDLRRAFESFNVHLAIIDDVFKHAGIEISDVEQYHGDALTMLYFVTGFRVYGDDENISVILTGSKYISCAKGRIDIKTPKIPLDNMSSYKWYNELGAAVRNARHEVSLYKEGKFVVPEHEDETPNPRQLTIGDSISDNVDNAGDAGESDADFENARV